LINHSTAAVQVWALALSESRLVSASLDSTIYVRSFRPADQACQYGGVRSEDLAGGGSPGGSGSDGDNTDSGSDISSSAGELDSTFASSGSSDAGRESDNSESWSEGSENEQLLAQ
jgi:hypothetical protein